MPQVHFQHGGRYESDIRALCNAIRANGTNVNCVPVQITHPQIMNQQITFHINLAYQANSQLPPANASLYTVAFSNQAGAIFRFNLQPPLPGNCAFPQATQLVQDGSYQSLGCAHPPFPNITNGNLANAVATVAAYAGGNFTPAMNDALVRLLIAVNEAVRFSDVRAGIENVLRNNQNIYTPPWQQIHNWGGHTLGC